MEVGSGGRKRRSVAEVGSGGRRRSSEVVVRVRISCVEVEGRSSSASIGLRPWGVNPSVHQCVSVYLFPVSE